MQAGFLSAAESLNDLRKGKLVMEPSYTCFSQTFGSLGVAVKKADVLIDSGLMTDPAGRIKGQRNSEYWQESRDEMYCSV